MGWAFQNHALKGTAKQLLARNPRFCPALADLAGWQTAPITDWNKSER